MLGPSSQLTSPQDPGPPCPALTRRNSVRLTDPLRMHLDASEAQFVFLEQRRLRGLRVRVEVLAVYHEADPVRGEVSEGGVRAGGGPRMEQSFWGAGLGAEAWSGLGG